MKFKLLLSSLFMLSMYQFSQAGTFRPDSLPFSDPEYKGYRLALTDIALTPLKDQWLKIDFTAINTGREDLILGAGMATPPSFVLTFDEQYEKLGLGKYKEEITSSLLQTNLTIRAGQLISNRNLKIQLRQGDPQQGTNELTSTTTATLSNTSAKGIDESFDENACSDLVIESLSVVKKTRKFITLKYKVTNNGNGPAIIIKNRKGEQNELAIKAHMSSSENLTRGSLPLGGTFISKDKGTTLDPGKSFTGEIRLDIKSMTRFTPVIILELDPYLIVRECDETNNLNHIKVE